MRKNTVDKDCIILFRLLYIFPFWQDRVSKIQHLLVRTVKLPSDVFINQKQSVTWIVQAHGACLFHREIKGNKPSWDA